MTRSLRLGTAIFSAAAVVVVVWGLDLTSSYFGHEGLATWRYYLDEFFAGALAAYWALAWSSRATESTPQKRDFFSHLAQSDTTAALEALRSGEPPLGDLTSDEQNWLVNAMSCLNAIYQKRANGGPGNSPFCIFAFRPVYVQFLAPSACRQLVCEAVSARSVPDVAMTLTPERENALRDLGFSPPSVSPNYSQIIEIAKFADLGYAARLAFRCSGGVVAPHAW